MSNGLLLLLAIGATIPAPAAAQLARIDSVLDRETASQVRQLIDSARSLGLPVDGMTAVAMEGAARHAPPARIVAAVRNHLGNLSLARHALGAGTPDAELAAGAGAIVSGVTAAQLSEMRRLRPSRTLTVPLVVLADLAARGVPVDTATRSVYVSLAKGARDEDFTALRRLVEQDIASGRAPGAAAIARLEHLPGVTSADIRRLWTMNHAGPPP